MRTIAQSFFERSPYMAGPLFTLMLFFFVFMTILVVLARSKKDAFSSAAALPLDDGDMNAPQADSASGALKSEAPRG